MVYSKSEMRPFLINLFHPGTYFSAGLSTQGQKIYPKWAIVTDNCRTQSILNFVVMFSCCLWTLRVRAELQSLSWPAFEWRHTCHFFLGLSVTDFVSNAAWLSALGS